ncbi:MAG: SsrA-binding protein SmpB [Rhodospirillales bacterium]|nr:SsrA-binding protein SmpB [Rhodospirillales bacterium]MCB9973233.1 SsrA-binding protein SmpB [Rhodospirillales bacterium]MCB9980737.1 SsrA-binding protein SmpB [Rhodospirillales bacterium]
MAQKKNHSKSGLLSVNAVIAENRRARYEYYIEQTFEAGIILTGTEIKSLRMGQASINEAHAGEKNGELWLFNTHIAEYMQAGRHLQHEPRRRRKLLLKRKEINKLSGAVAKEGYTLVPLKLYFDERGLAKLSLGLGKGKKLHDKRDTEKERDWNRQKQRIMKEG